jgi:hypothetical protein
VKHSADRIGYAWRLTWYPGMWRTPLRITRAATIRFFDLGPVSVEVPVRRRR